MTEFLAALLFAVSVTSIAPTSSTAPTTGSTVDTVATIADVDATPLRFAASYRPARQPVDQSTDAGPDRSDLNAKAPPPAFGTAGSMRFTVQAGGGFDVKTSRNAIAMAGVGVSYFMIDDLSLEFGLNALVFDQRGEDGYAPNFTMMLRWHFISKENWSMYVDGGAGVMYASRKVPPDGSKFNFTPQASIGVTYALTPTVRALAGVRWHHVSNARLYRDNPGRDHIMAYAGLSMPF